LRALLSASRTDEKGYSTMFRSMRVVLPVMLAGVFGVMSVPGAIAAPVPSDVPLARGVQKAAPQIRYAQLHQRGQRAQRGSRRTRSFNRSRPSRGNARPHVRRPQQNARRRAPRINRSVVVRNRPIVRKRHKAQRRKNIRRPNRSARRSHRGARRSPVVRHRIKKHRSRVNRRHRSRRNYYPRDYRRYDYYPEAYAYAKLSCRQAKRLLRDAGYRRVRAFDCRGREFGFNAKRGKRRYVVIVDAYTGEVVDKYRR
jgi:hypothetical protein